MNKTPKVSQSSVFAEANTVIDDTFLRLDRYELEEFSLILPEGLLYFATYLSIRAHENTANSSSKWERFVKNGGNNEIITNRNKWLSQALKNELDKHLTHLVEGTHGLLYPGEYDTEEE